MKKIAIITISIILLITLSACSKKEENKYQLIELQSSELLNYYEETENKNIIIALYYDNHKDSKSYLESLEKVLNIAKTNIYYINMNHFDLDSEMMLVDYLVGNYYVNSYYAIRNDEIVLSENYSSFSELMKSLKDINIKTDDVPKINKDFKLEALKKSEEELEKGNISYAINYLNQAWDLEEAKELYNRKQLYKLSGEWEAYHIVDKNTIRYINLLFFNGIQEFEYYETEDESKNIKRPSLIDYENIEYKVENNIIYVKENNKNNKFTEKYRIMYVTDESLQLTDLKNNQTYNFIRRINYE